MAKKATKALRVAGYCRTSSEGQRDNTSIPSQKKTIEQFASYNQWQFTRHYVDECKTGSKIAGRDDFQRMMRDAAAGRFDVLIVYDITRFSRDGFDILASTKSLKSDFGVDVVAVQGGFDTRGNLGQNFMSAAFAELDRLSVVSRLNGGKIRTARDKGIPSLGKLPWGRTFNRKTGEWAVDPEKKKLIEKLATAYLAGGELPKLARSGGMAYSTLHYILRRRCGTEWTVNFHDIANDKPAPVTFQVPRLLPESLIAKVHRKLEANKTKSRTKKKRRYLLSGFAFCEACGCKLTPAPARRDSYQYYRHGTRGGPSQCTCQPRPYVRCEQLDATVMQLLFDTYGNPKGIERAIENARPDHARINELHTQFEELTAALKKSKEGRADLAQMVLDRKFSNSEVSKRVDAAMQKEETMSDQLAEIAEELGCTPTSQEVAAISKAAATEFKKRRLSGTKRFVISNRMDSDFTKMTWDDARALVEKVFDRTQGKIDGRPPGIYISPIEGQINHRRKTWGVQLKGLVWVPKCVTQSANC